MRETLLSYLPEFWDRGEDTVLMGRSGLRTDYWSYRRLAQTAPYLPTEDEWEQDLRTRRPK